jgi:hypothetical protein
MEDPHNIRNNLLFCQQLSMWLCSSEEIAGYEAAK